MSLFGGRTSVEKLKARRDIKGLLRVFKDKERTHIEKCEAADALGEIKDSRAVESLIAILKDEKLRDIRGYVANALGRIGDARSVLPLFAALEEKEEHFLQVQAAIALGKIGDARVNEFVPAIIKDPKINISSSAIYHLQEYGNGQFINLFIAALEDENPNLREAAARALIEVGDIRAVEPLIHALLVIENARLRSDIFKALGGIGDRRAVEPLVAALRNSEESASEKVISEAIIKIGDQRAVEPLLAILHDEASRYTKKLAIEILGEIGDEGVVETLLSVLHSALDSAHKFDKGKLDRSKVSFEAWYKDVKQKEDGYKLACITTEALGKIGDNRSFEPLVAILEDKDERLHPVDAEDVDSRILRQRIRVAAANALGGIRDERAIEPLIIALGKLKGFDTDLQIAVAEALAKIGGDKAVKVLTPQLMKLREISRSFHERNDGYYGTANDAEGFARIDKVDKLIATLSKILML